MKYTFAREYSPSTATLVAAILLAAAQAATAAPSIREVGAGEYQVAFTYKPDAGTKTVHLAGEFNGWSMTATPMTDPNGDGRFTASVTLKKGRYEYKFVCDGSRWAADPENSNPPGAYGNSVLLVGVDSGELRSAEAAATTPPNNMVGRLPLPAWIDPPVRRCGLAGRHSMPSFSENEVTFVKDDPSAEAVRLLIEGSGLRMGHDLERTTGPLIRWAISLDRKQLREGLGYSYEVKHGDNWEGVLDSSAWSFTSRGGRPVGLLAPPSDVRGRIELIQDLKPAAVLARDIYVYLPPGYSQFGPERYAVLYVHDGQNCWDDPVDPFGHGGWQVNLTADRLIHAGKVPPFIVVGIANTPQRMKDYGPGKDVCDASDHAYIQFLIRAVKPLIDQRYRTLPDPANTAIMGSSMGGLISFQAALLHPDVFGMAGVMSPAFWFKDPKGQGYDALLIKAGESARGRVKIYLDSGNAGRAQDGVEDTRRMGEALIQAGWEDGVTLMRYEDNGAEHNERAWRTRLHRPLEFMFGK